jgi:N-methylhydantoinase B
LRPYNPILLEIYKHAFAAIADEMGVVLQRASYSPNIKERCDFSCALFDTAGQMVSQAAHIPVHLGSMPLSVQAAIQECSPLYPGDHVLLNDPFRGGTHLPDITLVTPVFSRASSEVGTQKSTLYGYVASRAHHADVGGMAPGSMTIARELYQEGLIIPPIKLVERGVMNRPVYDVLLANVRTPSERAGDLSAQIAANERGAQNLADLVTENGLDEVRRFMQELIDYTERMTRTLLERIPAGTYHFTDALDDDGVNDTEIPIQVEITIRSRRTSDVDGDEPASEALVDFSGSSLQVVGSLNAVYAITSSAVFYVIRSLLDTEVPSNAGCLAPIRILAPPGSIVNAVAPAPVAGGNVETSQRIVDVLLGALSEALPNRIPAASQGTMNNLTIGGWDSRTNAPFTYYETMAGGMGASMDKDGATGYHSHMTNTLNTPVEALEYAYPLRVLRYEIRRGSGGAGKHHGGDGLVREIEVLEPCQVSLITERRKISPYGLQGGEPGMKGENTLIHDGEALPLPGKGSLYVQAGDVIRIASPGGGGYGVTE